MKIENSTMLIVEESAFAGVHKIAEVLASDIELVSGNRPQIVHEMTRRPAILVATVGISPVLDQLIRNKKVDISCLQNEKGYKRECFTIQLLKEPFEGVSSLLVICGSDKRGTIYGMFTLSEYLGVTPLVFFGDAKPEKKEAVYIKEDINMVSKEPSVRYRGFFINDEWPCFGTWVTTHYGDFNANAYEKIFQFLLRMKGNYMWPAMWSASFPLDGPGSENEILADTYGVIMGYSHHEPCLRASEEWDKVKGPDSGYGTAWDFYSNEEGLIRYWRDALKRSGKYENIITIGMRGERDSAMLGEDSDIAENIEILKRIIRAQRKLIKEEVNEKLDEVPQMLALYKEVEAYFYGRGNTPGLKDWDELENVICMLCEDNFGNMRTLPTEEVRDRKGGFGMYYHLDYHGGPVSYEWVDSTPLSKIWEQMCMAYEHGVHSLWIVNVGDAKFHELPLSYFMALAYDYETYGISNPESPRQYMKQLIGKLFPSASADIKEKIEHVFFSYMHMNYLRRPESLHEEIYHPCHFMETDRMLAQAAAIEKESEEIYQALEEREQTAYYSMIHYPAMASMNLLKMHLYAGKNHHYARQNKPYANVFADLCRACMKKDEELIQQFAGFLAGKWNGMQLASHIGFTKWNDDDFAYPVLYQVEAAKTPRMLLSRADAEPTYGKVYGGYLHIKADDFCDPSCDTVVLEIANTGIGSLHYAIRTEDGSPIPEWLSLSAMEGDVVLSENLVLKCDREKLTEKEEKTALLVEAGDRTVCIDVSAKKGIIKEADRKIHQYGRFGLSIPASAYEKKKDTPKGSYKMLNDYGKTGDGMKIFPVTAVFAKEEEKPELTYYFAVPESGEYELAFYLSPTNPTTFGADQKIEVNGKEVHILENSYRSGENSDPVWVQGVLNEEHICVTKEWLEAGVQSLTIGARDAGVILERIEIYPVGKKPPKSYLGMPKSMWL